MDEVEIVKGHYDGDPLSEWNRLEGFHYEFEITKHMLNKYLKKGSVLDIGGGTGRYSIYLASLGYDVTLIDLSARNVEFAKIKAKELGVNIKAYQCDARDLSKRNLGSFDNVLLMGPLYHLFKTEDRELCVKEARKHLKDDGPIFVSFISLSAGLNYYLDQDPYGIIKETALDLFDCMKEEKTWSGTAFTEATFINNKDIIPFFKKLGFKKLTLFGQEGLTGTRLSILENSPEEVKQFYLDISIKLCEVEQFFSYSCHMMYIGTK
jgi:2-polyprenyl-3-methyl-5-hydroxy-6-metoxy-1,4-benzoquinol methylase